MTAGFTLALVAVSALARVAGQHRALACLACSSSGSVPSSGSISKIHVSVPTLPTPTTLRATRVKANRSTSRRRQAGKVRA